MSKKEEHNIKKLIQSIELDSPSENFAEKVMSKINYATDDELLNDPSLTSLLKKNGQEAPSVNFVDEVMAQIRQEGIIEYKPIISKKIWSVLSLLFVSSVVFVLLRESTPSSNSYVTKYSEVLEKIIRSFDSSIVESIQIPSILVVSTFCLSTLLLLDYFLNTREYLKN
ncbi:MAG: hypothetical protein QNK20_10890 [Aureibaculum sp.]|nr:hypothetical protein [Aureibaculum sp.]